MLVTPEITPLEEGRRVLVDTAADGDPEEIRYVFLRDTDYTDAITGIIPASSVVAMMSVSTWMMSPT